MLSGSGCDFPNHYLQAEFDKINCVCLSLIIYFLDKFET